MQLYCKVNKKHLGGGHGQTETSDFHCILFSHHSQSILKQFNLIFLSIPPKGPNKALGTTTNIKYHNHTNIFIFLKKSKSSNYVITLLSSIIRKYGTLGKRLHQVNRPPQHSVRVYSAAQLCVSLSAELQ